MSIINIQSFDGQLFEVDGEIVRFSPAIKNKLDLNGEKKEALRLPFKPENLSEAFEWASRHLDEPPQETSSEAGDDKKQEKGPEDVASMNVKFRRCLVVNEESLISMIDAAAQLDKDELRELPCRDKGETVLVETAEKIFFEN